MKGRKVISFVLAFVLMTCCFISPQCYIKAAADTAATYNITFNSDGGTAVSPITAIYYSPLTAPAAPTKEGYTFAGWSPSFPSTMPLNGETLTAQWAPNNYTIMFNLNGGSTSTYPAYVATPGDPTVDGVINPSEYGPAYVNDSTNASPWVGAITSSVKYYFAWSSKGLYVAVSNPAGVAEDAYGDTPKDDYQINLNPDNKIPSGDPGIFFGIFPNRDGSVKVMRYNYQTSDVGDDCPNGYEITDKVTAKCTTTNGISLELFIPTAQLQVVGVRDPTVDLSNWTPTADSTLGMGLYTIHWDADGTANAWTSVCGAGVSPSYLNLRAFIVDSLSTMTLAAVPPITAPYGSPLTAPAAPTKAGYTFAGWSPSFPSTMPLNGETLTARWIPNNNDTITFNSNGGTAVSPITAVYGSPLTAPAAPTRVGYTFAGWSPSFPSTMPLNGETLTAQWTPKNYTITFNTSGSSTYTAIPGDPTVDGVINPSEYGPTYVNDATNASPWVGAITSSVKYNFAWSSKGLYVAVSNPTGVAEDAYGDYPKDCYQINVNPDNKIPSGDPGVFFSFYPNQDGTVKVLRHNYQTPNIGDDNPDGYDISRLVNAKANLSNGISMEIFIPTAQLQVVGVRDPRVDLTNWMPTQDSTIGMGLYTIQWDAHGTANAWTSVFGADSGNIRCKAFVVDCLGTMTLASVPPITAPYGSPLKAPAAPTKAGYTFAGWSPSFPSTMPLNGATLTARWIPNGVAPKDPLYFNIPNSKIISNLIDGTYDSRYPTNVTVEIPSAVTAIKASDIIASNNDAVSLYTSPDYSQSDKVGNSGYKLTGNTATLYLSATNAVTGTVKYYQLNLDKVDSTAQYKLSAPATFTKKGGNYIATVTIDRQQAEKLADPKLYVVYTIQSGTKQFQTYQCIDISSSDTTTTKDIIVGNGFVEAEMFLVDGEVDWSQGIPDPKSNAIEISME